LGLQYCEDENNPNFIEAAKSFSKAASLGHANAQFNLGRMYEKGKGIDQSFKKAAEWYEKAALQGNPNAQCNLGVLLTDGEGVNKDIEKAID
jgi:TPR repeat protein